MGLPLLPDPPAPVVIVGPDRRRHSFVFRIWRAPTGISVELRESRRDGRDGYEFAVLGAHDADVDQLIDRVLEQAREEVARCYLRRDRHVGGWTLGEADEVAGRISYDPDGGPPRVVVDGRELTWDELGYLLSSYEGWRFRLTLHEQGDDLRPDARVVPLPSRARRPRRSP